MDGVVFERRLERTHALIAATRQEEDYLSHRRDGKQGNGRKLSTAAGKLLSSASKGGNRIVSSLLSLGSASWPGLSSTRHRRDPGGGRGGKGYGLHCRLREECPNCGGIGASHCSRCAEEIGGGGEVGELDTREWKQYEGFFRGPAAAMRLRPRSPARDGGRGRKGISLSSSSGGEGGRREKHAPTTTAAAARTEPGPEPESAAAAAPAQGWHARDPGHGHRGFALPTHANHGLPGVGRRM